MTEIKPRPAPSMWGICGPSESPTQQKTQECFMKVLSYMLKIDFKGLQNLSHFSL